MTLSRSISQPKTSSSLHARRPVRRYLATALCAGTLTTALTGAAIANGAAPQRHTPQTITDGHARTQQALDAIVKAGTPGVLAQVDGVGGRWFGESGVDDVVSGRPRLRTDHYRIGSITKTFIATAMLQLEAEGTLSLSDSVEEWLPGVVDGNGYDGSKITLRELLDHTSGIFDILHDKGFVSQFVGTSFFLHRYDKQTARREVAIALSHRADFPPGKGWAYSNTDYLLAAMVIRAATGHSYADEIRQRILAPLGLRDTQVPGTSPYLPMPHGHNYSKLFVQDPDADAYDVTEFNPQIAGPAGGMVSTAGDLNRFFAALLRGDLLPARQQREMFHGVDTGHGYEYGLGVASYPLPCGDLWGNDGDIFGTTSWTVGTRAGDHVMSLNSNANWGDDDLSRAAIRAEFCGAAPQPRR